MGALQLAIFMLIITNIQAVDALAQTPNKLSERLSGPQELALQGNTAPPLARISTKADTSPYLDAHNENHPLSIPLSSVDTTTSQPDLIVSDNSAPCSPLKNPTTGWRFKRRAEKQRRGATTNPESTCPSSAVTTPTGTDNRPSKTDGQQPQTEEKGQEQGLGAHDGSPKPDKLIWPNLLKIPTKDGDNPACFEATNGLMPVGVCENPTLQPEPSRWDVFMQVNRDMGPRAWKLPDSQLAWPGLRDCVPRNNQGIWCCRYYTVLFDGSGFGDICWPLISIEKLNRDGQGDWQQFMNPLLFPDL